MKKNKKNGVDGKNEKGKRGFNFVDVLLILLVVVVIFVGANIIAPMSFFNKLTSDSMRSIEYTVELTGVDKNIAEMIKEQDSVLNAVTKNNIGVVSTVDANTPYSVLDEHSGIFVEYDDRVNVLITITAEASYNEGEGYAVGEHRIAVGERMALRLPDFSGEGFCIGLSVVS